MLVLKICAFLAFFVGSAALQWWLPYRKLAARTIFANWRTNLALGFIGVVIVGATLGRFSTDLTLFTKNEHFGLLNWLELPIGVQILLSVLFLDALAYLLHRTYHTFSWLWPMHAVHHSDAVFEHSTALRFHPGEILLSLAVRLLVIAALGIPAIGLVVFEICYLGFNFIEHSNTALPPRLEKLMGFIFITPALHRKHHSLARQDLNSNYGTIFSFWDAILGSLHPATSKESITVGLDNFTAKEGLWSLLTMPIKLKRGAPL